MDIDRTEGNGKPIKRADRHPEHLQALKLQTDKILTLCDRGELDLLLKKS